MAAVWACMHSSATELDVDIVKMVAGVHDSEIESMRDGRMLCIRACDPLGQRALCKAIDKLKRVSACVGTHAWMTCPCCCRFTDVDSVWCQMCGRSTSSNFPEYVRIS